MRAATGRRLGPLPLLALASVAGALLGRATPVAPSARGLALAMLPAVVLVGLFAGSVWVRRPGVTTSRPRAGSSRHGAAPMPSGRVNERWRGVASAALALAATTAVATAGASVRATLPMFARTPELAARGGTLEVSGRVAAEPRRVGERWQVVLALERVGGLAARERAALLLEEHPPALGERVTVRASARPLPEGGYGTWLAQQHVVAIVDARGPIVVSPASGLAASTERLRDGLRRRAAARAPIAPAGLVVGLVSGDTRLLPEADVEAMRAAGLSHLTAVSGSNVALVLAAVLGALHALRAPPSLRRAVLIATIGWFALLTRLEPSVLRAGTMALLVVAADARGVAREAVHLLAGALLLLLAVDPFLAGSLGLLLSAGATLGVLVVAPAILERIPSRVPRSLAALAAVTLGAQLAVAPLLLGAFGEVPLIGLPTNLVAVPLAGLASALAVAGTVLVAVAPGLAEHVLAMAALPAGGVLAVARAAAEHPVALMPGRGSVLVALLTVGGGAAACVGTFRAVRRASRRVVGHPR